MTKLRIALVSLLTAACWGCGSGTLEEGLVKPITEDAQPSLDAELVTLNPGEVSCGVENGLWFAPELVSDRSLARLTDKGRSLGFSDDVSIDEPGYSDPYVQVRGKIPVEVGQVMTIKDGPEQGTKVVEVHVGVHIAHDCFPNALPIVGIRKGKFVEGTLPQIAFYLENNGWHFDKFVH